MEEQSEGRSRSKDLEKGEGEPRDKNDWSQWTGGVGRGRRSDRWWVETQILHNSVGDGKKRRFHFNNEEALKGVKLSGYLILFLKIYFVYYSLEKGQPRAKVETRKPVKMLLRWPRIEKVSPVLGEWDRRCAWNLVVSGNRVTVKWIWVEEGKGGIVNSLLKQLDSWEVSFADLKKKN